MEIERDYLERFISKKLVKFERDKEKANYIRFIFNDGSQLQVDADSLFDADGNYFADTDEIE